VDQGNHPPGQHRPRFQDESHHAGPLRNHDCFHDDAQNFINGRHADETDRFPAFSQNINYAEYPIDFSPVNMQNLKKYDGKQDPRQWLRIYSTAIEVAGGTNSTKVIYFPMALESAPLTWLKSLRYDSIHSWELEKDLHRQLSRLDSSPSHSP